MLKGQGIAIFSSMNKSLSQIEDDYIKRGYIGEKLRHALEEDKEYQELLNQRKKKLTKQFNVSEEEIKNYVLSTDEDYKILSLCKKLETQALTQEDKDLVALIKSQLEHEWRRPLMKKLKELPKRYKEMT